MIIELKNGKFTAQITSRGAELLSLCRDGREFMWQREEKYWGKTSPVLFPIVGNLRNNEVIYAGERYTMAKHGFCRAAEFEVSGVTDTDVSFSYSYNEETLKMYPYRFKLTLSYHLSEEGIAITYTVENLDTKALDYCFGAHPGFNVPLDEGDKFEDYCIEFPEFEPDGCPVFDFEKNQINMDNRIDYMKGSKKLMLQYDFFDNDALVFDKVKSESVKLYSTKTGSGVEVLFGDFDFVAFWTPIKAGAPFLCIEPWCGMAVCSDEGDTFEEKRGVKHLEIGEKQNFVMTIRPL